MFYFLKKVRISLIEFNITTVKQFVVGQFIVLANSTQIFTRFSPFSTTKDSRRQIFRKISKTALVAKDSEFIRLQIIFQIDVW